MKRSCVAGAVLTCVLAGSAMAADMPLKAPMPRVVSDWTGFYIGVHGGYGWARPSISDLDLNQQGMLNRFGADPRVLSLHAPKLMGGVFGGHAGYNWQWGQRGVVGLEVDYSAADIKSTQRAIFDRADSNGDVDARTLTARLDSLASARARVGFLLGPDFLLYGTGGAAWGHTSFTNTIALHGLESDRSVVSRASANHFGWVVGAGAEWKLLNSGLLLRAEYLHYGFGSASLPFGSTGNIDGIIFKGTDFNVPLGRLT